MFPPIEAYAVNFAGGNLQPHVNPYGWPNVQLSQQIAGVTMASTDSGGYRLTCRSDGSERRIGLYLVLPQPSPVVLGPPALPAEVRALISVTFDLPHAAAPDGVSDFTQPWAVSANFRIDRNLNTFGTPQVHVTSQFVKTVVSGVAIDGVRLNTPGSLQQVDQARRLDGPLVYARYWPKWIFPGALFTLDHAFCGYAAATNGHTPGNGTLKIRWPFGIERNDQRLYSSNRLLPLPAGSTIGAVGVSIVTETGVGTFGARVRSFRLWLDQQPGSGVAPVSGSGTIEPG
jgi:hypothetical protein